jgi:hypothetical protein
LSPIFLRKNSIAFFFIYILEANGNIQIAKRNTFASFAPSFSFFHKLQNVTTEKSIASYLLEPMFAGSSFFGEPQIEVLTL